jgi:hypothetical protein
VTLVDKRALPFVPTPEPFPHVVLDGYWSDDQLTAIGREFPHSIDPRWRGYENDHEGKLEGPEPMWGPETRHLLHAVEQLGPALGDAFGIDELTMETVGGGYHLIPPDGHLDIHTDFSVSPTTGLYRRLNFLVFLNPGWSDVGGHLELWSDAGPGVKIAPELNRTVVFETSDRSWHGHPQPATRWRMSVAAYWYSPEPPEGFTGPHSTVWRDDGIN